MTRIGRLSLGVPPLGVPPLGVPPLGILLALAACGTPPPVGCVPGTGRPMQVYTLFFGRNIGGAGFVSDADWAAFRSDTITANLPDGYTVVDASGAWAGPGGHATVTDPTKVLIVALPGGPDGLAAVTRIGLAYRHRFSQDLVGMTVQPGCGLF